MHLLMTKSKFYAVLVTAQNQTQVDSRQGWGSANWVIEANSESRKWDYNLCLKINPSLSFLEIKYSSVVLENVN